MPYMLDSPDTSDAEDDLWSTAPYDAGEHPIESTRDERPNWGSLRVRPLDGLLGWESLNIESRDERARPEYNEEGLSSTSSLHLEIGDPDDVMDYLDWGSLASEFPEPETSSLGSWLSSEDIPLERAGTALHRLPEVEASRDERGFAALALLVAEGQGQGTTHQGVQRSPVIQSVEDAEMNRPIPIGDLACQFRTNSNGYGAQCIFDPAGFSVWDEEERRFRTTPSERNFLCSFFDVEAFGYATYYVWVLAQKPPSPMPRTFAGLPIKFIGPDEQCKNPIPNAGHYSNLRVTDPCSGVWWPRLSNPTCGDRRIIIDVLQGFVNPRLIIYFPSYVVVELKPDTDRSPYEAKSLPGTIAGRTVLYHEPSSVPFVQIMGDPAREITEYDGDTLDDITKAVSATPESTYPFFNRLENRRLAEYYHRISGSASAAQGSWAVIQLRDLFPGRQLVSGVVSMMCIGCADEYRTTASPSNYHCTTADWHASNIYQIFGPYGSSGVTGQMIREQMVGRRLSGDNRKSEQIVTLVIGDFVFCTELEELGSEDPIHEGSFP